MSNTRARLPQPVDSERIPLKARKVSFSWEDTPLHWVPGDPFATHTINVLHLLLPAGERWFVHVYKQVLPYIRDERLREDVIGFIGQEAMHAQAHDEVLPHLRELGLDPTPYTAQVDWLFEKLLGDRTLPPGRARKWWLMERVAIIAAIEHYTAFLGNWVLNAEELDRRGADPTMLDLLRWHGAEEVEHRSVAFELFMHVDGDYRRRARTWATAFTALVFLWQRGARFFMANDPTLTAGRASFKDFYVSGKAGVLPSTGDMLKSIPRYLSRSYHPSQEGSTEQAVAYLASSPAALAALAAEKGARDAPARDRRGGRGRRAPRQTGDAPPYPGLAAVAAARAGGAGVRAAAVACAAADGRLVRAGRRGGRTTSPGRAGLAALGARGASRSGAAVGPCAAVLAVRRPGGRLVVHRRDPAGRGRAGRFARGARGVREGVELEVRGPRNRFPLVEAPSYVFVAGGIGITPVLPMLRALPDGVEWRLLYCGRTRASMPFVEEVEKLGEGRVTVVEGRPDLGVFLADVPEGAAVYCCGPDGLMAAVEEQFPAVHLEQFAPAPPPAVPSRSNSGAVGGRWRCRRTRPSWPPYAQSCRTPRTPASRGSAGPANSGSWKGRSSTGTNC